MNVDESLKSAWIWGKSIDGRWKSTIWLFSRLLQRPIHRCMGHSGHRRLPFCVPARWKATGWRSGCVLESPVVTKCTDRGLAHQERRPIHRLGQQNTCCAMSIVNEKILGWRIWRIQFHYPFDALMERPRPTAVVDIPWREDVSLDGWTWRHRQRWRKSGTCARI